MLQCQPSSGKVSKNDALVVGDASRARYEVTLDKLGQGSFGEVFKGVNVFTKEEVAIKFELSSARHPQLLYENKVYTLLYGGVGIPRTRWYGQAAEYNVLVMDLLGPSLNELFNCCHRKFSLKTVLMLAAQMITRVEYLHSKSLLHRDIKPSNFLMGHPRGPHKDTVFLIDFGLAKKYRDRSTQEHMAFRADKIPVGGLLNGTLRYASVNAHCGVEQSRRDDLEALGYVLVFLAKGGLPWQGMVARTKAQRREMVTERKMLTPVETLCMDLPTEFTVYLQYVRGLRFAEQPNYQFVQGLFFNLFLNLGYTHDYMFDWKVH